MDNNGNGGFVLPTGDNLEVVYQIIAAEGGNLSPNEAVNIASTLINRAREGNWGGGNDIYKLATEPNQYVVYQNGNYKGASLSDESRAAVEQLFENCAAGGNPPHNYQSFHANDSSGNSGNTIEPGGNTYTYLRKDAETPFNEVTAPVTGGENNRTGVTTGLSGICGSAFRTGTNSGTTRTCGPTFITRTNSGTTRTCGPTFITRTNSGTTRTCGPTFITRTNSGTTRTCGPTFITRTNSGTTRTCGSVIRTGTNSGTTRTCGSVIRTGTNSAPSGVCGRSGSYGANFTSGIEDDDLEYDYDAAMPILNDLGNDILSMTKNLSTLIGVLETLQEYCHDNQNSHITEDYKDFSTLIGDETSGISAFILNAESLCNDIYATLDEWHNRTYNG